MSEALRELAAHVEAALKDDFTSSSIAYGELTLEVERHAIVRTLSLLRDDPACRFEVLIDICGVDYPAERKRFELVYHLLSMTQNRRVRVKVRTDEETPVASVCSVYPAADWYEREAFDMFGILFDGHPDLRRILTDYGFTGYPLRKDFPLTGYVEVRYDEEQKRVVYEPVQLKQEYRDFDFQSPWEGMLRVLPGDEKTGASSAAEKGAA